MKCRNSIISALFLEYCSGEPIEFLEQLHRPTGINILADSASSIVFSPSQDRNDQNTSP